ncbi:Maph32 [Matsumuraeses phaseoli granulovirus]|uniref:Maph32 n=1 Tax=Matsumuraeses phaseoli granulovirus TaxID=2760664 RepID=A0AAE7MLC2_9BBAC|nr:Maph32 [Matsumuraeses phaseoli granulovirus]QOD39995.1 Maph32 [Matsumuraeses phaseoli granulovirus]
MHQDYMLLLKQYNNKCNQLNDAYQELQLQYDKTQFELRCVKQILLEICQEVAPHKQNIVQDMVDKHDKVYKTLHATGTTPMASIRFAHQLSPDLGSIYVWNTSFI